MAGRRRIALAALLAAVVAVVLVVLRGGGSDQHTVRAAFTSALQVRSGQTVQIAGRKVGSIRSAKLLDGKAVVELAIDDEHWPLRRGTVATLRYGSTLGYALRYVDLEPGPRSAPAIPEGGVLTQRNTVTPVEFDDVTRIYGPDTRRNMSRLLRNAGAAMRGTGPEMGELIERGAEGMEGVANQTADLAEDPEALKRLILASAALSERVARNRDRLGPLFRDASTTLETMSDRSEELGQLLAEAPRTFDAGQRVLSHLNRTSDRLELLARTWAPGAKELRAIAPVSNRVTATLAETAPRYADLLRAGSAAMPSVTRFMRKGDDVLPLAGKAVGGLVPVLGCIRPYAPELTGYLSTAASAHASYDSNGHYIRFSLSAYPVTVPSTMTPQETTSRFPRLTYAMNRPPGYNVGQPWMQPQCGITPTGLDPAQDLEASG